MRLYHVVLIASIAAHLGFGLLITHLIKDVKKILDNSIDLGKKFVGDVKDIIRKNENMDSEGVLKIYDETGEKADQLFKELQELKKKANKHFKDGIPKDLEVLISETEKKLNEQRKPLKKKKRKHKKPNKDKKDDKEDKKDTTDDEKANEHFKDGIPGDLEVLISETEKKLDEQRKPLKKKKKKTKKSKKSKKPKKDEEDKKDKEDKNDKEDKKEDSDEDPFAE